MKCPLCAVDLNLTERSGVEIDYCPKCRGVWLDRGELDKIIALSAPGRTTADRYSQAEDVRGRNRERAQSDYDDERRGGRQERESWFGNLFDFGD
jgi:Zn-finger nucleic acid-binding protein